MPSEELKSVKKEENNDDDKPIALAKRTYNIKKEPKVVKKELNEFDEEDDDDHKPISLTKKKTPITKAMKESTKLKKELSDEDDHKPLAKTRKTSATKVTREVKKKKVKKEIKKVRGTEQKKKERKVYDLPGQKRDQPDEKDPLRIFYESLNKQVPNCEMAQIWLMESGLLPKDVAMEVYEKQKKSMQQRVASPVKAATVVKRSTKSVTVKRKTKTSVKKKTTNSTSKLSKKRKSDCMSSEDEGDSDYGTGSKTAKRRKAA